MTPAASPDDDLLPDNGPAEDLRHKVEAFIEEEEGGFPHVKGWRAAVFVIRMPRRSPRVASP